MMWVSLKLVVGIKIDPGEGKVAQRPPSTPSYKLVYKPEQLQFWLPETLLDLHQLWSMDPHQVHVLPTQTQQRTGCPHHPSGPVKIWWCAPKKGSYIPGFTSLFTLGETYKNMWKTRVLPLAIHDLQRVSVTDPDNIFLSPTLTRRFPKIELPQSSSSRHEWHHEWPWTMT